MAEKISVQIALEGGREIARQLESIGEAGQKAFADIASSAEQVGGFKNLQTDQITAKLKEFGIEGSAAFDKIQQAVKTAARFESVVQGVQGIENAFIALGRAAGPVGLAIAAGMQAAAKATIAFAETISQASDNAVKLGLSFDQFKQQMKDFEQIGVIGKPAVDGLRNLQKQMEKTIAEADPKSLLAFFGDPVKLAQTELPKLMQQLRQMPDGFDRTNLAIKNFGEAAGTAIIQGLRRAEGSMTSAEAKAYDLGQAIQTLGARWAEFGSVQFAPAITAGINAISGALENLNSRLQTNPFMAWVQVASFLNPIHAVIQAISAAVTNLASSLTGITWGTISSGAQAAWQMVVSAVQAAGSAISNFISQLTGITWDSIASAGAAAWNQVVSAVQGAGSAISGFISSLTGITWDAISGAGVAAWNAITQAIQNAINAVMQFIGLKPSAPATGGEAVPGIASGGVIGGRGTGTSDSNLAWVSRGEHIMPARAVAQPGMLAFLEALRRSGGNLRHVLDGMNRFALGGLVPRAAYAGGGAVGSMSNVTINFPGLEPIGGLRASDAVVEQLRKAAALAQVRSGGRKPSRYS